MQNTGGEPLPYTRSYCTTYLVYRLMQSCEQFVHSKKLLREGIPFFSSTPHQNAANFIVAWILDK